MNEIPLKIENRSKSPYARFIRFTWARACLRASWESAIGLASIIEHLDQVEPEQW